MNNNRELGFYRVKVSKYGGKPYWTIGKWTYYGESLYAWCFFEDSNYDVVDIDENKIDVVPKQIEK